MSIKRPIKRATVRSLRFLQEVPDLFRRRKTEKPHLAGWPKKSQILIGPVEKNIVKGEPIFKARFIPARKGSQLAPLADHNIVIAMEAAAHQVAVASMKKFENISGHEMLVSMNAFKWRKKVHPKTPLDVEVKLASEQTKSGINFRLYNCTFFTANEQRVRTGNGEMTIALLPKEKSPAKQ